MVEKHAVRGKAEFLGNELIQVWVIYHIQMLGEAAANVTAATHAQHESVPWPDVVAMRNVLVHHYFGIDLEQVWDTVATDLPQLKTDIRRALDGAEAADGLEGEVEDPG